MAYIYMYMAFLLCEWIFQNIELNAAHHLRFVVETLWSPKTMLLIKSPKIWVSTRAITFCLCVLWKACITWHFWATNRKLTFSWKITPQDAIPPLNSLRPGKMDAISQTTLSNAFSWMKILEIRLEIYWGLFLRILLTIFQHWFW